MILLLNPWIHDFAAYDMWMMPLGLLHIGKLLELSGFEIIYHDLLQTDRNRRKPSGEGKIWSTPIEKSAPLKGIKRKFKRYGESPEEFIRFLQSLREPPSVVLITSKMTYWYTGVQETIEVLRSQFPNVKVILGGSYAMLLPEHARARSGADYVVSNTSLREIDKILSNLLNFNVNLSKINEKFDFYNISISLLNEVRYLPLLTTIGCPFRCSYCASPVLFSSIKIFSPKSTVENIIALSDFYNVRDIVIFDDAFLHNRTHAKEILYLLEGRGFKIHTPNALHARFIDDEIAELIKSAGFKTIRLGFETVNEVFQKESGGKVTTQEFSHAVRSLHRAGFRQDEIGVYLMAGLPGQRSDEVREGIDFVFDAGATPKIVEYSPVPRTPMFLQAKKFSRYDLEEPLYQNNSIFPCEWEGFTLDQLQEIKFEVQQKLKNSGSVDCPFETC